MHVKRHLFRLNLELQFLILVFNLNLGRLKDNYKVCFLLLSSRGGLICGFSEHTLKSFSLVSRSLVELRFIVPAWNSRSFNLNLAFLKLTKTFLNVI